MDALKKLNIYERFNAKVESENICQDLCRDPLSLSAPLGDGTNDYVYITIVIYDLVKFLSFVTIEIKRWTSSLLTKYYINITEKIQRNTLAMN